jgi:enoyl-CoA hydratase/carnithine racemase
LIQAQIDKKEIFMETPVLFEVENSTAVITLNRPER